MAKPERWMLPDGIEELMPEEASRLEQLRRLLLNEYQRWGYGLVMPPLVEFLDALLIGSAQDLNTQTFKLTDQLSGRTLGVRADITPQVARIDTHFMRNEGVARLCYAGSVLHTKPSSPLSSRSPFQVGCELFGDAHLESDLEVIHLMAKTLSLSGCTAFRIDLGHVGIYRGLMRAAALGDALQTELLDILVRKSRPDLQQFLRDNAVSEPLARMIETLPTLLGSIDVLDRADACFADAPDDVKAALATLRTTGEALRSRLPDVDLFFDLGELRGYHYHTGLVFAAYADDHGEALAVGGRYDGIGEAYDSRIKQQRDNEKPRPATGFSADLRKLRWYSPAKPQVPGAIAMPHDPCPQLWAKVEQLRHQETVIQRMPGQTAADVARYCDRELVKTAQGEWVVQPLATP